MIRIVALLLGCAFCAVTTTGFLALVGATPVKAERPDPNFKPKDQNFKPRDPAYIPKPKSPYSESCKGGRCANPNPPKPKYENCGFVGPCPTPRPTPRPNWENCKGGRCANPNWPRPKKRCPNGRDDLPGCGIR
jgi:hypothetical protein